MVRHIKNFFIPHKDNGYNPYSLRKVAMKGMVLMVLLSFAVTNIQSFLWTTSQWMVSTVLPGVIVDLTNQERHDHSLGTLKRNAKLDAAAKLKAEHMAEKGYFAHFSPNGVSPWYWFRQVNYNFVNAGENLAIHFTDSDEVVEAWMNSPTHRANIINKNYTEIGVGTAKGKFEGYNTIFVVQLFGTPVATNNVNAVKDESPKIAQNIIPSVLSANIEEEQLDASSTPDKKDSLQSKIVAPIEDEPPSSPPVLQKEVVADNDKTQVEVLSQEVQITEEVVVIKADPIPSDLSKEIVVEDSKENAVQLANNTAIKKSSTTEDDIVLSFIATTTGGIPASIDSNAGDGDIKSTPSLLRLLTQPTTVLQIIYAVIALFVLVSLLLSIGIEIRRHHPVQIAYSLALLLLMFGLLKVHELLSFGAVIL